MLFPFHLQVLVAVPADSVSQAKVVPPFHQSLLYSSDKSFLRFQLVKGSEKKNKIIVSSHENFKGFIGYGMELGHLSSSQMSLGESSLLAHILEAMLWSIQDVVEFSNTL